jgi:uncharacterized iron-regulated protein
MRSMIAGWRVRRQAAGCARRSARVRAASGVFHASAGVAARILRRLAAATVAVILAFSLPVQNAAAKDEWLSSHFQEHPLAGTIWSSDFEAITFDQLETTLSKAGFVLLGETHNNPDHHRLQARLISGLVRNGRHPAVVFEMIPVDLQAELDRYLQGGAIQASSLGKVLRWEERGWPDWSIYQPIAEAAISAGLPLLGGGLDGDAQKLLARAEPSPRYTQMVEEFGLAQPLEPQIAEAQGREIKEAHCNLLPEAAMEPMTRVQRARDAQLAKTMLSAKPSDGAVLIAGAGHVRKDWAVPRVIQRTLADPVVVSIAFLEVDPERTAPSDYIQTVPGLQKPYDFIYFTPRADLTDHCAEFAKHMNAKNTKPAN